MTWTEAIQVASSALPLAAVLYYVGRTDQKIRNIEQMVAALLNQEAQCRASREEAEDNLDTRINNEAGKVHSRINAVAEDVARIKGTLNGALKNKP